MTTNAPIYDEMLPFTGFDVEMYASDLSDYIENNKLYLDFRKKIGVNHNLKDDFQISEMKFNFEMKFNDKIKLWDHKNILDFKKKVFDYLKEYYGDDNCLKEFFPEGKDYFLIMYRGSGSDSRFLKGNKGLYDFYNYILDEVDKRYDDSQIRYDIPLSKYKMDKIYKGEVPEENMSYSREEEIIKEFRNKKEEGVFEKIKKWFS